MTPSSQKTDFHTAGFKRPSADHNSSLHSEMRAGTGRSVGFRRPYLSVFLGKIPSLFSNRKKLTPQRPHPFSVSEIRLVMFAPHLNI
jgi:hypothetical protein